ncbi:hypothetical protein [Streptomyces acidiscabies]|uniref:hypothetical protein n=1 Tax=Streptomyces acidiscabies TaxID=42234 RepID=UPI00131DA161|nr:hypothetical protein [Streptomyces acidiscabies]
MADREAWLKALMLLSDTGGDASSSPCPDCGQYRLEVRYIVDAGSRIGYALFWCGACLHGVKVSRARAPEGVPIRLLDDSSAVADVPNFIRHD